MNAVELDLPWLEKIRELINAIAKSYDLDPAVVAAVISRESGGGRLLGKWGNPPDTGDRGHGRGLMQADDRFWKGLLNLDLKGGEEDAWRHPAFNIAFGCWLLKKNIVAIEKKFPGLAHDEIIHAALAAYNSGLSRALRALREGTDVDAPTAGRDYGKDVMERAEWLRRTGWT
jgi:soluble lytic murein transglycosylase-like protein